MARPCVSVIVPTYNRAALLAETLSSVRAQTLRDYELIVIDDGSTDGTEQMLERWGEPLRVGRIAHRGEGAARNAGLDLACGEYVAFLDSDDLWAETFLGRMVAALEANRRAGFVYCDYALFDSNGVTQRAYLPAEHKRQGDIFAALLRSDFLCVGAVLVRRETCATLRFDAELPVAADWDFWLRLARTVGAAYLDEPLLSVRVNPAGAGRSAELVYRSNLRVLARLARDFPTEARRFHSLFARQTSNCHRALFAYYARARQPIRAIRQGALAALTRFA